MATRAHARSGRLELERWYRLELRPKVARAAERRAIDPRQAAAFERAMTALIHANERPRGGS